MEPRDVRQVGVVGCGLMGSGIVEVVARTGAEVTFVGQGSGELIARGRASVDAPWARRSSAASSTRLRLEALLGRVTGVTDLAGLDGSDLVIEAATEDFEAGDLPVARGGDEA